MVAFLFTSIGTIDVSVTVSEIIDVKRIFLKSNGNNKASIR